MWPVKNCFVNFFWTFDTVLSISEWFLSDISCGDFLIEKKRYYIFYIAYCGVLIAHWEILLDFFFSLLNDRFDKKRTHWTVRTCEKMQNFRIIAVSSWWIETGDYFECKWSSMIIEWKKSGFKSFQFAIGHPVTPCDLTSFSLMFFILCHCMCL